MTINQAYELLKSIVNKEQRGYLSPAQFNLWAPIAQVEAIKTRLGNIKALNNRQVPQFGYKITEKLKMELRPLIVGPTTLALLSGAAQYPSNFWYIDSLQTTQYVPIEIIDTDEYARVKQSQIYPPTADYPVAVFYGSTIVFDPPTSQVLWTYVKYPDDPFWNHTFVSAIPVYNPTGSVDFQVDKDIHIEIVWRMAKYAGINIDMQQVTQMAMAQEATQ